jgi:hypothetical protein
MANRFVFLSAVAVGALLTTATLVAPVSAKDKMMMGDKMVMVGGAAMYPSKNIVENAVHSKDHTTLVAAVKAAGRIAGDDSKRQPVERRDPCREHRFDAGLSDRNVFAKV